MANLDANAAIAEAKDALFPVIKVSPFLDNGAGGLVRQAGTAGGTPVSVQGGYSTVTSVSVANNTAGTAIQLASAACKMVEIFVPTGNTSSQVAVGGSNVKAAAGSEVGTILISGVLQQFYVTNANLLYFDVGTNGDKISYNVYN